MDLSLSVRPSALISCVQPTDCNLQDIAMKFGAWAQFGPRMYVILNILRKRPLFRPLLIQSLTLKSHYIDNCNK